VPQAATTGPATSVEAQADPAGGEAPAAETGKVRSLFAKLYAGGSIVGVQLLLSVVGLGVAIERFSNLRRSRLAPAGLARDVDAAHGRGEEAIRTTLTSRPSVLAVAIKALYEHGQESRSEALAAAGAAGRPLLRRHIQRAYPIAIIAMLQPLLGLLGTVWGLIGAFEAVALAGAMGNPSIFADEIALALVTTAVGLAVAIPLLGLYHYFKSRTVTKGTEIEEDLLLPGRPLVPCTAAGLGCHRRRRRKGGGRCLSSTTTTRRWKYRWRR